MVICPGCKAVLKKVPKSGDCPKCGHTVRDNGTETDGPHSPTLGATQEFTPQAKSAKTEEPAATMELPPADKGRSISIAPRKLSAKNVELITNTWQSAVAGDADQRSSLKLESKRSVGSGSSLAVNLRGVRSVDEEGPSASSKVRPTSGADYELLQVIGKGGMGVVYSARQASVDRMVAVKMIRPTVASDSVRREKFLSEAVVTGDLDHPNIVPIYELGTDEHNALFYSMKRVQGTPWSHVLDKKPLAENLDVLMKVADAVAFAHANGVVHRDLKPENVMLGDFGEVLVMDWGLALATAGFRHAEFVTRDDSMGGTPAYMAPEMVTGPFDLIGPPCDIYLLGALLFEVATGLRPHTGKSTQDCLMAAARNQIQPTEVTGELVEIAYHAMATEPSERYASVQEFQAAIRDYQSHMESISLASRADQELAQAKRSGDYQGFARALFGFEEARAMWEGNTRARSGISEAKLAYSASAKQKGDYELGISLLDADDLDHVTLHKELEAALRERDARQKWLSRFKRIAAALVVLVFGVVSVALVIVADARDRETAAKQQAIRDRDVAQKAEQAEKLAREEERKQKELAVAAEKKAKEEELAARKAEEQERIQKENAIRAERVAEAEREKALLAKQGEEQAAYVARIGMASAKIDENAFDTAKSLLAACLPETLRHWEWGYLKRLSDRGFNFPATGTVSAVAYSPDGTWFVTAGQDRKAHLWDRQTRKERLAIDHPTDVQAVAVSPDGEYLATGGSDGILRVVRVDDGKIIQEIKAHGNGILSVAFSPRDGRFLLSSSRDNTARIWDAATGREIDGSPLVGHYGWVWSAQFAPDAKRVVTAGQDGKVIVWSFQPSGSTLSASGIQPENVFLGHQGAVFTAAFSPDGRQIASGGYDKRVLLWQPEEIENVDLRQLVATGQPIAPQHSRALEGHSAPVHSLTFSPDGAYLLSAGDDNTVRIWDAVTARPHANLRGHSRPVLSCAIAPDGRQVLSGGQEDQIKLWDIANYKQAPPGRVLEGHEDAILAAAFSPDGTHIVTGSRDHTARVFQAATGQSVSSLQEGHEFLTSRAVYFDQGRRLLTAAGDNTVRIWDAASGAQLHTMESTGRNAAIAVSPDSNWILTGKYVRTGGAAAAAAKGDRREILQASQQIALWEVDAGRNSARQRVLDNPHFGTGHPAIVTITAISPDARMLFSGDGAGIGILWDAATGAQAAVLDGHTDGITGAAFLPAGGQLLTSSKDGTIARWDVASGKELAPPIMLGEAERRDAFDTPVTAMAISRDGRQILTLSEDSDDMVRQSIVRLWDVESATLVRELHRGADRLGSVAFSDDGSAALAAGSRQQPADATSPYAESIVRRWDLNSGSEVTGPGGAAFLDLAGRREIIRSAIDVPGGAGVLTVGGNGATLWNAGNADTPDLLFKPHSGVTATGFSTDGKHVVTGSSDRRVKIWNTDTGRVEMQLPQEHSAAITSAGFSPTETKRLLTAAGDGTVRIWDLETRRVTHVLAHAQPGEAAPAVRVAIFSPDGKSVLSAGDDAAIRLWNAGSGELIDTLPTSSAVYCAAFSRDGSRILAGFSDGRAMIFDAQTHKPLVRFSGHTDVVNSVAFSPDGHRALTGSRDRLVKIWDTVGAAESAEPTVGKELLTLRYHDQPVTTVAFSPDGKTVLSASLDGTAVIWPTDTAQPPVVE